MFENFGGSGGGGVSGFEQAAPLDPNTHGVWGKGEGGRGKGGVRFFVLASLNSPLDSEYFDDT